MSVESTDRVAQTRLVAASSERQTLGDVCAGCAELAERVERLERQLLEQVEEVAGPKLGTTSCYWICIGVHAFVTFSLFTNAVGVQFGLIAIAGSVGTLAVCHVLSTRPIHVKLLRTVLSITIVGASAIVAMSLADIGSPSDLLPSICIYFPILFGSAWLAAKMFVWTRGWRVIPPNGASEFPKLRIWHLLLCTFVAAVYLAIGRFLIADTRELLSAELLGLVLQITLPTAICTAFTCTLAKIILLPHNPRALAHAALLASSAFIVSACGCIAVSLLSGGFYSILAMSLALMLYAPLITLGILASPCFTFLMLRIANYRFATPGKST